ncbi:hypothetical protein C8A00DRAFT_33338 [Chaetomidium leptoderma]|uniref:Uncharacterized protein n=1 Tax=Chaetomidium leptoderma TaxID=669021 RepID=A0AAN6VLN4_9PEZI|nr:hypothetical protein C8A00DRAFT_33338 [Chaetomidium leptoderma]
MAEAVGVAGDAIMSEAPAIGHVAPEQDEQHLSQHQPLEQHHHGHHGDHGHQQSEQMVQQHSRQHSDQPLDHQLVDPAISAPAASSSNPSPVPPSFPKKRRGRPPGRPNATVRDADYEQDLLVQTWNAAKDDRAVPVVSINIRNALTEQSLVHETQRTLFRLPSREIILFVQGWITAKHIASKRPSYVNGLLIHSRGQDAPESCVQCTEKRAKNAIGPFLTCRMLPDKYHNSCSNCKWFDNTSTCSLYTGPKPNRKRKAKEQLPPPPATGVGPPSDIGRVNGDAHDTDPVAGGPENTVSEPQPFVQAQPHAQALQPEADMTPTQQGQHEQPSTMTPAIDATDNDPSGLSQPHTEPSASDLAEMPSQPDSLTDSHFGLSKPDREGDAQEAVHDDGDYVAAQLAAQLLPEIQRSDA